jgi:hypothetical protein
MDGSYPAKNRSLRTLLVIFVKRLSVKNPYSVPISRAYNAADCDPLVKSACCVRECRVELQRKELQDKN